MRVIDVAGAFARLNPHVRAAALLWIREVLTPSKSGIETDYALKHRFEADSGICLTADEFAGALAREHEPTAGSADGHVRTFKVRPRFRRAVAPLVNTHERATETIAHADEETRRAFVALVAAGRSKLGGDA